MTFEHYSRWMQSWFAFSPDSALLYPNKFLSVTPRFSKCRCSISSRLQYLIHFTYKSLDLGLVESRLNPASILQIWDQNFHARRTLLTWCQERWVCDEGGLALCHLSRSNCRVQASHSSELDYRPSRPAICSSPWGVNQQPRLMLALPGCPDRSPLSTAVLAYSSLLSLLVAKLRSFLSPASSGCCLRAWAPGQDSNLWTQALPAARVLPGRAYTWDRRHPVGSLSLLCFEY